MKQKKTETIQPSIEEISQMLDRQSVEISALKRELEIDASLEKIGVQALGMHKPDDLLDICEILYLELYKMGFDELRYAMINIYEEGKTYFINYDYAPRLGKTITRMPYDLHPLIDKQVKETKNAADAFSEFSFTGKDLTEFRELRKKNGELDDLKLDESSSLYYYFYSIGTGSIGISTYEAITLEKLSLLKRFRNVFNLSYQRYADIAKAEEQAKEAQIEAALEKVRSAANAMHTSNELLHVITIVGQQLEHLGIEFDSTNFRTNVGEKDWRLWIYAKWMDRPQQWFIPAIDHPYFFIKEKEGGVVSHIFTREEKDSFEKYLFQLGLIEVPKDQEIADKQKTFLETAKGFAWSIATIKSVSLNIANSQAKPYTPEENALLLRFTIVFEQAYTRFLDLQKAEAQAREAQIEAALERVRSRSMGMQKSDELAQVVHVMDVEIARLGIQVDSTTINTDFLNKGNGFNLWLARKGQQILEKFYVPEGENKIHEKIRSAIENGIDYYSDSLSKAEKDEYYQWLFTFSDFKHLPEERKQFVLSSSGNTRATALSRNSFLIFHRYALADFTEEEGNIFKRFAKAFEQAYTRFLDLQKAEAQAKEAIIETALEKIRSRSLAMHRSNELKEVITVIFEKMTDLNVLLGTIAIQIFHEDTMSCDFWLGNDRQNPSLVKLPYDELIMKEDNYMHDCWEAKANRVNIINKVDSPEQVNSYFDYVFANNDENTIPLSVRDFIRQAKHHAYCLINEKHSSLFIDSWNGQLFDEEKVIVLKRVAKVFDQAYIRFLDLQKAEAQAREAQIETALEKVRSRSLAMHRSDELKEVVNTVYERIKELDLNIDSITIIVTGEYEADIDYWIANEDESYPSKLTVPIISGYKDENHIAIDFVNNRATRTNFSKTYTFEQKNAYFLYLFENSDFVKISEERKQFLLAAKAYTLSVAYTKNSALVFANYQEKTFSEEENNILQRFANVFEQSYIRFLDLQKAEAQARESQIEAALERVRSRTLAMQKSDELAETAAEVFRQLIVLGIEPNRLYIGIIKGEEGDMEMWATDEDGTQVGKKFMFNKNENASVRKLYDGWITKQKSVIVNMEGKELEDYFHYLNHVMHIPFKEGLTQKRRVQSVAYFSKGFIGMASPDGQGDETILLLERFASVFNLTFTRFNDLKIAEAHAEQAELDLILLKEEKKRTEEALIELQITQKQLIQSEKMASLGELTAGIAHEIQNPLNFVNNFSEVSTELVDEMNEEIHNGNLEDAQQLAKDLKENLEKINHHGKRAGDIVKGMLQHSRSSSGAKEPTDINALADEYLRLAYHGLRAKDKSFNATLITDFDESIGKIDLIPQDMGRVILNLITNAFYAVSEKKRLLGEGFEPTVTVSTKKSAGKILISVTDNGNGIPQKVVDKIFQPFFTTKPTGQGTGLGLSLSYDIVKAHGGEIKVEIPNEGGAIFLILLPLNG